MVSGVILEPPMASVIVCHGSESRRLGTVRSALLEGRREGDAESVGVAVPMGARLEEGCGEEALDDDVMTTELRRRG